MPSFSPPPGARKTVKYLRILSLLTGGRGFPYKKDGLLIQNFQKDPYEVPRSCFVGVA